VKILTFTTLFPNQKRADFGLFVYQRVSHLAVGTGALAKVIAPVPYFPSWVHSNRWGVYAQIPYKERFGDLDVYHPRYPLFPGLFMPLHGFLMFLGSILLAHRLHTRFRFDCIDAHYVYPDGFAATLLGKVLGLPVVISARGTDVNLFMSFRTIRPLITWSLRNSAGIIAVAGSLKKSMVSLGVPEESICVIPNGVDTKRFHPHDQTTARGRLKIPSEEHVVVSVGSLTESKNHCLLVSAFAEVLKGDAKGRLYIIGNGPLRPVLEALIRNEHLEGRVILVGPRPNEELALWFSAADVSCLTSCREGCPNVLMESIACGTPVVATRVGGVPELLCSPKLGILVEQNKESVAAGLKQALATRWDRKVLERHAQKRGWDKVAEEVASFLMTRVSTCSE
jgi:glycosyltransferase involved in cell wall biosynthesis